MTDTDSGSFGRHQRSSDPTSGDFLTLDEAVDVTGLPREDVTDLMFRILHPGVGYLFYAPAVAQTRSIARAGDTATIRWRAEIADNNNRRQLEALHLHSHYFRKDRCGKPIEFPSRTQVIAFAAIPCSPGALRRDK